MPWKNDTRFYWLFRATTPDPQPGQAGHQKYRQLPPEFAANPWPHEGKPCEPKVDQVVSIMAYRFFYSGCLSLCREKRRAQSDTKLPAQPKSVSVVALMSESVWLGCPYPLVPLWFSLHLPPASRMQGKSKRVSPEPGCCFLRIGPLDATGPKNSDQIGIWGPGVRTTREVPCTCTPYL